MSAAPARMRDLPPPAPTADRTLDEVVAEVGGSVLSLGFSKDPNGKVSLLIFPDHAGQPSLVAKVALTEAAERRVLREAVMLRSLQDLPLGAVADTVPRVVGLVVHRGRRALVTTAVPGATLQRAYHRFGHRARPRSVTRDFDAASQWLAAFQRCRTDVARTLDGLLEGVPQALSSRVGDDPALQPLVTDALNAMPGLRDRLSLHACPCTPVHGDFWFGNVLTSDAGCVSGVVDWESARPAGLPVHDLARFVLAYSLYLDRHTRPGRRVLGHPGLWARGWGPGVEYAVAGQGWYPRVVREFLRSGLARLGVSPDCWRDVLLAEVLVSAAEADHPGFAVEHLRLFARLSSAHDRSGVKPGESV